MVMVREQKIFQPHVIIKNRRLEAFVTVVVLLTRAASRNILIKLNHLNLDAGARGL